MMDFDKLPGFMLDRAIRSLERVRADIDAEISSLQAEKNARDWQDRQRRQMQKITRDLTERGFTDEKQALQWLCEQGHSWKYAKEILSEKRRVIEAEKKAAREVEIFRRWNIGGEDKTALAREFGVSRSTVERICRRLSENGRGLKENFRLAYGGKRKAPEGGNLPARRGEGLQGEKLKPF